MTPTNPPPAYSEASSSSCPSIIHPIPNNASRADDDHTSPPNDTLPSYKANSLSSNDDEHNHHQIYHPDMNHSSSSTPLLVHHYVQPRTNVMIATTIPPDSAEGRCLQQGHNFTTSWGIIGILSLGFCFPWGLGVCLTDRQTSCKRCGKAINTGCYSGHLASLQMNCGSTPRSFSDV